MEVILEIKKEKLKIKKVKEKCNKTSIIKKPRTSARLFYFSKILSNPINRGSRNSFISLLQTLRRLLFHRLFLR